MTSLGKTAIEQHLEQSYNAFEWPAATLTVPLSLKGKWQGPNSFGAVTLV